MPVLLLLQRQPPVRQQPQPFPLVYGLGRAALLVADGFPLRQAEPYLTMREQLRTVLSSIEHFGLLVLYCSHSAAAAYANILFMAVLKYSK